MKIIAMTDGPLLLEGKVEIVDQNGIAYTHRSAMKCALCRCGGSSHKPFCDGTHLENGFRSAPESKESSALSGALNRWASEGGHRGPPVPEADGRPHRRHFGRFS